MHKELIDEANEEGISLTNATRSPPSSLGGG